MQANSTISNTTAINRLTALWAINEAGLGGSLHALHLPITGFVVGAIAVVIIGLIAWFSTKPFQQIMQATLIVLLIKATVSPQSPPPAYLAVAFQGLAGACLFGSIRVHAMAMLLLAVLAMVESALQKLIVVSVLYGKSLWQGLDALFTAIVKDFHLPGGTFSTWLIGIYLAIYCCWGWIIGWWAGGLPLWIQHQQSAIIYQYRQVANAAEPLKRNAKKRSAAAIWLPFVLVLVVLTVILLASHLLKPLGIFYIIIRTLAALILLLYVIKPVLTWLIQRWASKQQQQPLQQKAQAVINLMPAIQQSISPVYQMSLQQKGAFNRLRYFMLALVVVTLYPET